MERTPCAAALEPAGRAKAGQQEVFPAPVLERELGVESSSKVAPDGRGDEFPSVGDVLESQHGEFLSCFARFTDETLGEPEVQLIVSVRENGTVEEIGIEPSPLVGTSLATCLSEIASRLQFPTIRRPTSFQVPLRITANSH